MAKDWSEGHSPSQNRRFNRDKPAITEAKTALEKAYDDSPEEFYDRIFAGMPPEQKKYMVDTVNKLPPDLRFDSLGGLLSLVGYGMGDNRATISNYDVTNPGTKDERLMAPGSGTLGYYRTRRGKEDPAGSSPRESKYLKWYPGESAPLPGKGIAVFNPRQQGQDSQDFRDNKYSILGPEGWHIGGVPETIWHELAHRGFDSPALAAFGGVPGSTPLEHKIIDAVGETRKPDDPNSFIRPREYYDKEMKGFSNWLTPKREAEYGVTKFHDPADMSMLDKIIDLLRNK